jgi:hypothetical protein
VAARGQRGAPLPQHRCAHAPLPDEDHARGLALGATAVPGQSLAAATPVGERVEPVAQIRRSLEARKEFVVAREQACLHEGQFWQGASS